MKWNGSYGIGTLSTKNWDPNGVKGAEGDLANLLATKVACIIGSAQFLLRQISFFMATKYCVLFWLFCKSMNERGDRDGRTTQ